MTFCKASKNQRRMAICAAASVASLALLSTAGAIPIGDPNAGNGWSTLSAVTLLAHSGEAGGRDMIHLIDGGGISGPNGEFADVAAGGPGFVYYGMSRFPSGGGVGASAPNPGTLQGTGSGHWFELGFDQAYTLDDLAIWNDNQDVYEQGWKHIGIQVSMTGGTDPSEWTTVIADTLLPKSPGPDGIVPAHANPTLPAAVLQLGGVQARYVSIINPAAGNESNWYHDVHGGDSADNFDMSEIRFNSGLTAGVAPNPNAGTWSANGGGSWFNSVYWSGGVAPNGVDKEAHFLGAITASRFIYADSPVVVGTLQFDNANTYILGGAASLSIQVSTGSGLVDVVSGPQKINLPLYFTSDTAVNVASGATLTLGNPTTIRAGKTVTVSGAVVVQAPLILEAGATIVNAAGPLALSAAPSIGAGAKVNLKTNSMTVNYSGQVSPAATIKAQLTSGYASGSWTGEGINTSSAVAGQTGLGWKDDAANKSILVKYTYYGDANLDGQVDISDLGALATAWQTSAVWSQGDFDYNGLVDISDLGKLATNWQAGVSNPLGPSFDEALASVGLAGVSVPEPTAMSLLALGLVGVASRRRRHA